MDLTELTDEPELTVTIGGMAFNFSDLPINYMAKLQAWIKANVPDPLVELRSRLEGYPESVIAQLTAEVRREYPAWPPIVSTREAAVVLMGSTQGQVQTLWVALMVHYPTVTIDEADKIYRALKRMRDEKLVTRIYTTIFGTAGADGKEDSDPKGQVVVPAATTPSNGNSFSAPLSSVSK
jgi:hypothetical protein